MEDLAEKLAATLRIPLSSPFAAEKVIVQSLGMRKWLSLELAAHNGICANCEFPFPKQFVSDIFTAVFPEIENVPAHHFYSQENLTWRIMRLLPGLTSHPAFGAVRNYINGKNQNLKLFQLSEKIARLFDQYIVFRPKMILDWERGADERDWQAILWREIIKEAPVSHQAALGQKFSELLKSNKAPTAQFPERISIFGISSLPPFYIQLLGALAEHVEIHFFLLDPTDQYWGAIISDSEEDFLRRKLNNAQLTAADLHADQKNSLLASLGKTGRDFQDLVLEISSADTQELFDPPDESNLLTALQSDIFQLRDSQQKRLVAGDDDSIQVHSCHSPMREMEVLHDQLLALFEKNPRLMPKDIIVMMPDVKTYAPYIEAVFGSPETDEQQIPFTIADRGLRAESGLADAFLRILETARGRFGASGVLAILESPTVQRRFHLSESNLETIRAWVEKTGIRWGIDAAHRARLGLPELDQNTWRAGLRRLLLGYALPGRNENIFAGILPYDEIEGALVATLGNFIEFAEKLFVLAEQIETPRSLNDWQALFFKLIVEFFADDEDSTRELRRLREIIGSLSQTAEISGFDGLVAPEVILAFLKRLLDSQETGSGFMNGQLTFCALRPMRSVPFKVVCLVGMNDGSFPRRQPVPAFDKISASPQRGDRNSRHDDRYLFLEAILSARDALYISYVGQSLRDNSALTPSVLVSELLDYLERGFHLPKGELITEHLVTRHKLQAFSPAYFSGDRLFSYSAENCAASKTTLRQREVPACFVGKLLPEPEPEFRTVALDSLAKFYSNPAEFFLGNRLGVRLEKPEAILNDREAFDAGGLIGYGARTFLAEKQISGTTEKALLEIIRAGGELPPGHIGDCYSRGFATEAKDFLKVVACYTQGTPLGDISFEKKIGVFELAGTVRGLYPDHLLRHRCAKLKVKDVLRAWIQHLALNSAQPNRTSVLVCLDKIVTFQPVAKSDEILGNLLENYWRGLREPLKFFPATSYAYALRHFRPNSRQKSSPRETAEAEWKSRDGGGESEDPSIELCFRGVENPLDEEWEKIALEIFEPILAGSSEEKL